MLLPQLDDQLLKCLLRFVRHMYNIRNPGHVRLFFHPNCMAEGNLGERFQWIS